MREFKKFGINPEVIDISTDSEARAYVMSLGHKSLPVVVAGEQIWSEHRADRIRALAA